MTIAPNNHNRVTVPGAFCSPGVIRFSQACDPELLQRLIGIVYGHERHAGKTRLHCMMEGLGLTETLARDMCQRLELDPEEVFSA